jgi:GNAT superfamily N-acetyltransferase
MSMESRFARFGSGIARLSEAELRYLTDIDQRSHVAWGATVDDQPAGIGRFIVDAESDAEVAVAVVDRFQRRGLGRALFDALIASARDGGIRSFTFSIEPWNREVLRMLPGVAVALDEADGMLVGKIQLDQVPIGEREQEMVTLLDEFREGNMAD